MGWRVVRGWKGWVLTVEWGGRERRLVHRKLEIETDYARPP